MVLVLVMEVVSVLVVKGSPYWGWRRFAHFASPRSSLCASKKEVAERDGVGEGGEDPAEHWWPPQPGSRQRQFGLPASLLYLVESFRQDS